MLCPFFTANKIQNKRTVLKDKIWSS